ncbi:MAG: CHASE3 domain-containing protein [Pseudonocardiaceae bacterium]
MVETPARWSLRWWLRVVGAICVGVALAAMGAGELGFIQLSDARAVLADQLDPALLSAQTLDVALVDQETSVRGFVITGKAGFLAP